MAQKGKDRFPGGLPARIGNGDAPPKGGSPPGDRRDRGQGPGSKGGGIRGCRAPPRGGGRDQNPFGPGAREIPGRLPAQDDGAPQQGRQAGPSGLWAAVRGSHPAALEELVAEGLGPSPALTLADQMTEWDRIYWCLRSLELSDKVAADRSLARLDGWLHNGYAEAPFPSKDQFERIKPLLGNLEGKLSEEKVRMLQFALGQN